MQNSPQSGKERAGGEGSTSVPFLVCFLLIWLFKAEAMQKFSILKGEVWIVGEVYSIREIFYHSPHATQGSLLFKME